MNDGIYDIKLTKWEFGRLMGRLAIAENLRDSLLHELRIINGDFAEDEPLTHITNAEDIVKAIYPEEYAKRVEELKEETKNG